MSWAWLEVSTLKGEYRMVTRMWGVHAKGLRETGHAQEKGHWKHHAFEDKNEQLLSSLAWIWDLRPAAGEPASQEEGAQPPPERWHTFTAQ